MWISNLTISSIFIHVSHPLYIGKHNLKQAMDEEDFGLIAVKSNIHYVWFPYYQIAPRAKFFKITMLDFVF